MGQNNIQREPITNTDIARYNKMVEEGGDKGVTAVYDELEQKGYASASWLKDEYSKNTVYGTNTNLFFKNQTGQNITPELASELNQNQARAVLEAFDKKVSKSGRTVDDLDYEEMSGAHQKAYKQSGFEGVEWMLDRPVQTKMKLEGNVKGEAWYTGIRDVIDGPKKKTPSVSEAEINRLREQSTPKWGPGIAVPSLVNVAYQTGKDMGREVSSWDADMKKIQHLGEMYDMMNKLEGTAFPFDTKTVNELAEYYREARKYDANPFTGGF